MNILELKNLSKYEGANPVLDNINFSIPAGSICGIISDNPNSTNKLINIINGIDSPNRGEIHIKAKKAAPPDLKKNTGVARGQITVIDNLSAIENMFLGKFDNFQSLGLINWKKIVKKTHEIMRTVNCEIDTEIPAKLLTKNDKIIIEIMKTLVSDYEILIFEQITEFLSAEQYNIFKTIINKKKSEGKGIIISTNRADEINELLDKLYLIKKNKIMEIELDDPITQEELNDLTLASEYSQILAFKEKFIELQESNTSFLKIFKEFTKMISINFFMEKYIILNSEVIKKEHTVLKSKHINKATLEEIKKCLNKNITIGKDSFSGLIIHDLGIYTFKANANTYTSIAANKNIITNLLSNPLFKTIKESYIHCIAETDKIKKQSVDQKDVELAGFIQQSLLKEDFTIFGDVDIYALSIPAKNIAGDFYDIIKIDDKKVFVTIIDVSGKGVAAGIVMMMIRSILQTIDPKNLSVSNALATLNNVLKRELKGEKFATAFCYTYDAEKRHLEYANAGHEPMLVIKPTGEVKTTTGGEIPLGLSENAEYKTNRFVVENGDILTLYTDGVIEARNKFSEDYGMKRFIDALKTNRQKSTQDLCKSIITDIKTYTQDVEQHDDISIVTLKV